VNVASEYYTKFPTPKLKNFGRFWDSLLALTRKRLSDEVEKKVTMNRSNSQKPRAYYTDSGI
jgi:hypothetical protein